jgi:AmiR/NasT family two-component response regulator
MDDQLRAIEEALLAADDALDRRLELALAEAERLRARIGRDPQIEDAKIELARLNGCSPCEAFDHLRRISQSTSRPIRELADDIVAQSVLAEPPLGMAERHLILTYA